MAEIIHVSCPHCGEEFPWARGDASAFNLSVRCPHCGKRMSIEQGGVATPLAEDEPDAQEMARRAAAQRPQSVELLSADTQWVRMRAGHAVLLGFFVAMGFLLFYLVAWFVVALCGGTITFLFK
jgi:endogenous inhibitor of DNA gyrase (YacG/DUF329 family)